jgi:hypothetical protein
LRKSLNQLAGYPFVKNQRAQSIPRFHIECRRGERERKNATPTNETAEKTLRDFGTESFAPGGYSNIDTRRREGFIVNAKVLRCCYVQCLLQRTDGILQGNHILRRIFFCSGTKINN